MAQPPPLELFLITLAQSQDDVVLEGVDADRRPARLAVSGFRPHFYVGPVADDVDATNRQADLCRAAPAHAVSVTKVTRTFLCGIHEPRTYLRVAHRCGAAQSTLVRKCEQLWTEPPCEDGVPLLRRFLVETHLSGGAWLVARNVAEAGDRRDRRRGNQHTETTSRRWRGGLTRKDRAQATAAPTPTSPATRRTRSARPSRRRASRRSRT
jgi:hypothetical protein